MKERWSEPIRSWFKGFGGYGGEGGQLVIALQEYIVSRGKVDVGSKITYPGRRDRFQ